MSASPASDCPRRATRYYQSGFGLFGTQGRTGEEGEDGMARRSILGAAANPEETNRSTRFAIHNNQWSRLLACALILLAAIPTVRADPPDESSSAKERRERPAKARGGKE